MPLETTLPTTRKEAIDRLKEFLPHADQYAKRRNLVVLGHTNASRLSPATRTRLLLETEICDAARVVHRPSTIEKFEQEIWWRIYWKGWLEMRPSTWSAYRSDLEQIEWTDRALEVAAGKSGVAIIDHFTKELIKTGYLANHARMWWASFWIHIEKLPWQLGADFFLRHLWDGDAASNTLSWRWVAGLHTKGKAYLVRRSNLETYVQDDLLEAHSAGLDKLENITALDATFSPHPEPIPIEEPPLPARPGRVGIWIHDEDLLVENSPLDVLSPSAIFAPRPISSWRDEGYSHAKMSFLTDALNDGCQRASRHFGIEVEQVESEDLVQTMVEWAERNDIETIFTMRPFVGVLAESWEKMEDKLEKKNVELMSFRRSKDVMAMNRATAGFFGFWKKTGILREG